MHVPDRILHLRCSRLRRLDDQEELFGLLHFSLPPINGFNLRDDVDAGSEPLLHESTSNFAGLFVRTGSGQDDSLVSHIKSGLGWRTLRQVSADHCVQPSRHEPAQRFIISNAGSFNQANKSPNKQRDSLMTTQIKFGTSGWRAVMAEEFTCANVRRAVTGIARYVVSQKPKSAKVIVGRDPRFLGETFCAMAAEILSAHGIAPLVIVEAAPTPAISYAVMQAKADGAINFTASHNPPEYNGIKFSTPDGAPALPEVTRRIEAEVVAADGSGESAKAANPPETQPLDPRRMYLSRLPLRRPCSRTRRPPPQRSTRENARDQGPHRHRHRRRRRSLRHRRRRRHLLP